MDLKLNLNLSSIGGVGSVALAQILYKTEIITEADGTRKLKNEGSGDNAPAFASNHLWLNGIDQSVEIPLDYVMGADVNLNPDMETNVDGYNSYNTDYYITSQTTSEHHSGSASLKFECIADGGTNIWFFSPLTNASLTDTYKTYEFRYWVKYETWNNGRELYLEFYNAGTITRVHIQHTDPTLLGVWQECIFTVEFTDDNFYWSVFKTEGNSAGVLGDVCYLDDFTVREIITTQKSISFFDYDNKTFVKNSVSGKKKYEISRSFSQCFLLNIDTTDYTDYLNANQDAIQDIWTGRKAHQDLPFAKADLKAYYPASEGTVAGSTLTDLVSGGTIDVINYTEQTRTELANTDDGATDFYVTKDSAGLLSGHPSDGELQAMDDGRYLALPMSTEVDYLVNSKNIKQIEGSDSEAVVTFADDTTETITP